MKGTQRRLQCPKCGKAFFSWRPDELPGAPVKCYFCATQFEDDAAKRAAPTPPPGKPAAAPTPPAGAAPTPPTPQAGASPTPSTTAAPPASETAAAPPAAEAAKPS